MQSNLQKPQFFTCYIFSFQGTWFNVDHLLVMRDAGQLTSIIWDYREHSSAFEIENCSLNAFASKKFKSFSLSQHQYTVDDRSRCQSQ